jgi:recombination protein RecA
MARPKKSEVIVVNDVSDKAVDDVLSIIDKINPDAANLSENSLSNVTEYIDTGNYSLNAIMSGSVYGGVPVGRICGFFGPPATGKTLITNKIIANAQKSGFRPVYFDSEQALDKQVAIRLGCDADKIKHVPVEIIEDCRNQIFQILTKAIEAGLKKKLIICIDSLGALNTNKELNDSLENKNASDMGLRAKQLKSMLLKLTYRAAKSETPIIFTNHIYDNPGDLYPSMVKKQAGGMGPLFIASLLVQLSSTNIKTADDKGEVGKLSDKISGTNLRAFITKNRFVPPYLSTEMYLNFRTGLDRYSGLLELAKSMGLIEQSGAVYNMGGEKLGYASTFEKDPEFWNRGPLDALNKLLVKELTYSNESFSDIKQEVESLDKEILNDSETED